MRVLTLAYRVRSWMQVVRWCGRAFRRPPGSQAAAAESVGRFRQLHLELGLSGYADVPEVEHRPNVPNVFDGHATRAGFSVDLRADERERRTVSDGAQRRTASI